MFSLSAVLVAISLLRLVYATAVDLSLARLFARATGCSISGPASCHNTTIQSNLCCFESPGGLLLQTQFWDLSGPGTALPTSWTVHGLWPDNCDGTFTTNCDPSRAYTGMSTIIQNAGQTELLNFMNTYWVDINGQNEQFWEHEWAAHGTCLSTLRTQCLPPGSATGTDAVDYFLTVERLFKSLTTYIWLQQGGITPSSTQTFTLSQLTTALRAGGGVTPALDCSSSVLNQIRWYFNLKGSAIDGVFVPIDAPTPGSCPSSGIRYPPKPGSGGGGTVPARSHLNAIKSGGQQIGALLSAGTLSVQTPATYTATTSGSGFTLTTSKGNCGISGGQFTCGSGVTATVFGSTTSGSQVLLTVSGSSAFTAASIPSGTAQIAVFTGSSQAQDFNLVFQAV